MLEAIKNKLFSKPEEKSTGNGLYASMEELMEMRKLVNRVRREPKNKNASSDAGDVRSAFKGRGIELEEIRLYSMGDDVRDINWRVTARKDEPYTNVYNEEKDHEIYVFLDLSQSMVFGTRKELKSVAASKLTALLAWMSLNNGDRFGLVLYDGKDSYIFKAKKHQSHILAILKKISEVSRNVLKTEDYADEADLVKPLGLVRKSIKSHAQVFVLSDFSRLNDEVQKQIGVLSKSSRVYCMNIFDVLEEIAPLAGEYSVENKAEKLVFDSSAKAFRSEYQNYFAEKKMRLKDFCKRFRVHYVEIRTDLDLFNYLKL